MMLLARTPTQVGAAIRRRRKLMKLSQSQLGEKCGLRQETISIVENGNLATRLDTLLAILAALDLELQIGPRLKRELDDVGNMS